MSSTGHPLNECYKELTKLQALEALSDGKRVSHRHFTANEYMIQLEDGRLRFEDGVVCSIQEFFQYRTGETWETGYFIHYDQEAELRAGLTPDQTPDQIGFHTIHVMGTNKRRRHG